MTFSISAKIQDGSPKSRSQDKCVFAFYTEIQDGGKAIFEKCCQYTADTLRVKNLVEIALSRTVSKINTLLHFTQKFKMVAKSGGKATYT